MAQSEPDLNPIMNLWNDVKKIAKSYSQNNLSHNLKMSYLSWQTLIQKENVPYKRKYLVTKFFVEKTDTLV